MNMDNNITQLIFELQNIEYDMNVSLQKSKNTFSKIKNFLQYIRKLELNNSKLIGNIDNLNEIIRLTTDIKHTKAHYNELYNYAIVLVKDNKVLVKLSCPPVY